MDTISRANGTRSRQAILDRGLELAARGGLHTATIGGLSSVLGMSKSGVFAHFGSKGALDLALVDNAAERFAKAVVAPAVAAPPGIAKVVALCEGFLAFVSQPTANGPRLTPDHPAFGLGAGSAVSVRLAAWRDAWQHALADEVAESVRRGEMSASAEPAQVAFELDGVLEAAGRGVRAHSPAIVVTRARRAIDHVLLTGSTG